MGVELNAAADAAQALLDKGSPDVRVVRDPTRVQHNGSVFVFGRTPPQADDALLVVDKVSGEASFVTWLAWDPPPFADLVPVETAPPAPPGTPLEVVIPSNPLLS